MLIKKIYPKTIVEAEVELSATLRDRFATYSGPDRCSPGCRKRALCQHPGRHRGKCVDVFALASFRQSYDAHRGHCSASFAPARQSFRDRVALHAPKNKLSRGRA